ncbi:MAG: dienelactone hydrolase family protein [Candidatus Endonucleobacter bathymodioli]|uniref:Dienelactone hydrolase family protein n=1 Tax=Candidatus Endonucleibacter bathymodioli TaxID=539814 RepID=A0AA90P1F3_9GAMM|nr:dienelactone hydrolase family protein [Candidatus Endonucleobacter bathymodioli]
MRFKLYLLTLCFIIILIGGCVAPRDNQAIITSLSLSLNARAEVLNTSYFPLQTLQMLSGTSSILRVYIEGDGHAWVNRRRPSRDPTPRNLMVLELMGQDTYPDCAYLARPCQFVWGKHCNIPVWTSLRYSEPMVDILNEALNQLKGKGPYEKIELIGFSGGGTLALLLASRRDDVASVRTVAGNLCPSFVNWFHGVSPMAASLNPVDFSAKLATIPQLHFIGGKDSIITSDVYDNYRSFFDTKDCLSCCVNPGAGHNFEWSQVWLELLKIKVKCRSKDKLIPFPFVLPTREIGRSPL